MIRYPVNRKKLISAINKAHPNWFREAQKRTDLILRTKAYTKEKRPIWRTPVWVYIRVQHEKCAYCEMKMEGEGIGQIQFDLEHFRPKTSVKNWPPKRYPFHYGISTGGPKAKGYYWLTYNTENFAAACKPCNTILKRGHFPIARKRGNPPASVRGLRIEKPYLCYPVGDIDVDPKKLITFSGTIAIPAAQIGHGRHRGRIIIDFFELNSRLSLHYDRAHAIMLLGNALINRDEGRKVVSSSEIIKSSLRPGNKHTNCSEAFFRLWKNNRDLALRIHKVCGDLFRSSSMPIPLDAASTRPLPKSHNDPTRQEMIRANILRNHRTLNRQ